MSRILPKYGIDFVEIPRYEMDDIGVVTATKVREALSKKIIKWLKIWFLKQHIR